MLGPVPVRAAARASAMALNRACPPLATEVETAARQTVPASYPMERTLPQQDSLGMRP